MNRTSTCFLLQYGAVFNLTLIEILHNCHETVCTCFYVWIEKAVIRVFSHYFRFITKGNVRCAIISLATILWTKVIINEKSMCVLDDIIIIARTRRRFFLLIVVRSSFLLLEASAREKLTKTTPAWARRCSPASACFSLILIRSFWCFIHHQRKNYNSCVLAPTTKRQQQQQQHEELFQINHRCMIRWKNK